MHRLRGVAVSVRQFGQTHVLVGRSVACRSMVLVLMARVPSVSSVTYGRNRV